MEQSQEIVSKLENFLGGIERLPHTSLEDLKTWCEEEDQDFAKSVGCYKKIMKVKTPDDVFDNIHHSRKFFEELGPVTDFSVTN